MNKDYNFYLSLLSNYEHDDKVQQLLKINNRFAISSEAAIKNGTGNITIGGGDSEYPLKEFIALKLAICEYGKCKDNLYLEDLKSIINDIKSSKAIKSLFDDSNEESNPILKSMIENNWITTDNLNQIKLITKNLNNFGEDIPIEKMHSLINEIVDQFENLIIVVEHISTDMAAFQEQIINPMMEQMMGAMTEALETGVEAVGKGLSKAMGGSGKIIPDSDTLIMKTISEVTNDVGDIELLPSSNPKIEYTGDMQKISENFLSLKSKYEHDKMISRLSDIMNSPDYDKDMICNLMNEGLLFSKIAICEFGLDKNDETLKFIHASSLGILEAIQELIEELLNDKTPSSFKKYWQFRKSVVKILLKNNYFEEQDVVLFKKNIMNFKKISKTRDVSELHSLIDEIITFYLDSKIKLINVQENSEKIVDEIVGPIYHELKEEIYADEDLENDRIEKIAEEKVAKKMREIDARQEQQQKVIQAKVEKQVQNQVQETIEQQQMQAQEQANIQVKKAQQMMQQQMANAQHLEQVVRIRASLELGKLLFADNEKLQQAKKYAKEINRLSYELYGVPEKTPSDEESGFSLLVALKVSALEYEEKQENNHLEDIRYFNQRLIFVQEVKSLATQVISKEKDASYRLMLKYNWVTKETMKSAEKIVTNIDLITPETDSKKLTILIDEIIDGLGVLITVVSNIANKYDSFKKEVLYPSREENNNKKDVN